MQLPHLVVGDTPTDLGAGLAAGSYLAQVLEYGDRGMLIATGAEAPTDLDDWFIIAGRAFVRFEAGCGAAPTWARSAVAGSSVTVARARQ